MFLEPIFMQRRRARVKQVTVGCGTHEGQETCSGNFEADKSQA